MKDQARETQLETRRVVSNATSNLPDFAAVNMPALQNLKKTVIRERNRNDPFGIPQQLTLGDLVIPDELVRLANGDNFLLHDSGPETGNRR